MSMSFYREYMKKWLAYRNDEPQDLRDAVMPISRANDIINKLDDSEIACLYLAISHNRLKDLMGTVSDSPKVG